MTTDSATSRALTTYATAGFEPDQLQVLASIGLDPRNPAAQAVVAVAQRYGLDPVLGHVLVLPKAAKPYITRDGLLHVAHSSGLFDGVEIDGPHWDPERKEWTATASVYRSDKTRPFRYPGWARDEPGGRDPRLMAIARAERRALLRAFDVAAYEEPEPDELGEDPAVVVEQAAPQPAADTPDQRLQPGSALSKAMHAAFHTAGIDDRADRLTITQRIVGRTITSSSDLTTGEATHVVDTLTDINNGAANLGHDDQDRWTIDYLDPEAGQQ